MAQSRHWATSWTVGLLMSVFLLWACGDGNPAVHRGKTDVGVAGSTATSVGGSNETGAGGATEDGVGGASQANAGRANQTDAGGADPLGTAGANPIGAGGADPIGAGGTNQPGSAGTSNSSLFESDDPTASANNAANSAAAGAAAAAPSSGTGGSTSTTGTSSSEAERAIVEADIVQVVGDMLYALSNYSGLSVIDVSAPENLRLLGRYTVRADPFEMYVRDGIAYAMYSAFPRYEYDSTTGAYKSITSSRLVAIDARNPAAMKPIGNFDLPGTVSDSRMVGDVVYVVSYENGYCWRCEPNKPRTTVTSIKVADPAAISQIQQLAFEDQQSSVYSYKRSISVTTNRIYVSGMNFDGTWGSNTGHSTIQVVDISDPGGKLALGAELAVTGQIESRWQMDEYEGVLRVLSQSGSTWANGPAPTLETFKIVSAQSLSPLGKLTLTLPESENLKSVRFDGTRAYAVTFRQTDPLFTLDVSNPAAPRQMGEVLMPGYLYYMEPRGDRMIALGMDSGNTNGGLTVSIFDVADLAHPALLSRANFGGTWGWAPEDQDRIHKAFRIFDEVGLIVMPFSGWSYASGSCGRYASGVQLLDFTRDTVTARGVVPVKGQAKRALLHRGQLLAVSDDQVGAFNIANRDAPVRLDALALSTIAQKSVRVGENIVSLGLDWWLQTPQITVTPIAGGANTTPLATLELASTLDPAGGRCYGYWSSFYRSVDLFVNGNLVYFVYDAGFGATYSDAASSGKGSVGFAVVDLTDPATPKLVGTQVLPLGQPVPPLYTNSYYYYYNYGFAVGAYSVGRGIWASGSRIVQLGSTIVLEELVPINPSSTNYWQAAESTAILHAVDLANPAVIREVSALTLAKGISAGGLFANGQTLLTTTYESVPENPSKVRFYVEKVNYGTPASPAQSRLNVPGSLLTVDAGTARVVTVDYKRTIENIVQPENSYSCNYPTCNVTAGFGSAYYQYAPITTTGTSGTYTRSCPSACVRVEQSLRLVDLLAEGAQLVDTYQPTGDRISQVIAGTDRLWFVKYSTTTNQSALDVATGIRAGKLTVASTMTLPSWTMPRASGTMLSLVSYASSASSGSVTYGINDLVVYDTVNPAVPNQLFKTDLGIPYYYVRDIALDRTHTIVSAGNYGAWALAVQ